MRAALLSILLAAAGISACSGPQNGDNTVTAESPFTPMPQGDEHPDLVFFDADAAFQLGDFVEAQRQFGTLYIIAPDYRGGVPAQGITATCERVGVNCDLVFGRLELMREVIRNHWGPMHAWVPAQRQDFTAIVQCYERSLSGNYLGASQIGTPVVSAPDPYFSQSARRCVDSANTALAAVERQRQADAALLVWFDNAPCMNQHRNALLDAFDADDWELFVNAYPQYQTCAATLQQIIDDGVLAGDPRLGMEHDVAWSDMSEIDAILEDYATTYQETRTALIELDSDPEYNQLGVQWNNLTFEESRLENQIRSLETAAQALTGGNRAGVEQQIANQQQGLVEIRTQKRELMAAINARRRALGLTPRETP